MMTDDDDAAKDGDVSEEDLLEVNESEDEDEDEKGVEDEASGFDEFGNPIDE